MTKWWNDCSNKDDNYYHYNDDYDDHTHTLKHS